MNVLAKKDMLAAIEQLELKNPMGIKTNKYVESLVEKYQQNVEKKTRKRRMTRHSKHALSASDVKLQVPASLLENAMAEMRKGAPNE